MDVKILGLPFETLEMMMDTLALMAWLPVLIGVSVFYLTRGSAMAREFPSQTEGDIVRARSTAMAIETGHAKRDDLYTLFIAGRMLNFLKGLSIPQGKMPLQKASTGNEPGERRGPARISSSVSWRKNAST
jgi:hypothetical protein